MSTWKCTACETLNDTKEAQCIVCGASQATGTEPAPSAKPSRPPRRPRRDREPAKAAPAPSASTTTPRPWDRVASSSSVGPPEILGRIAAVVALLSIASSLLIYGHGTWRLRLWDTPWPSVVANRGTLVLPHVSLWAPGSTYLGLAFWLGALFALLVEGRRGFHRALLIVSGAVGAVLSASNIGFMIQYSSRVDSRLLIDVVVFLVLPTVLFLVTAYASV